jgi:AAA domain
MAAAREPWRGGPNDPYLGFVKVKDLPERPEPAFLIGTPQYPVLHDVSTVLYGRPKAGKSAGALTMAYSLATGEPFMGIFPVREIRNVAYLALDSGQVWETKRRIDKWGESGAFGEVLLSGVKPGTSPDEWNRMASRLEAMGINFLFIDNLARLKGGERRSVRNDEDMDPILQNIDILESRGIAFCLVHHSGKPGEDGQPRSSPLGATTIEAWARNFVQVNAVPVKDSHPRRTRRWLELYGNDLEGERGEVPFAITDKGIVPAEGYSPGPQANRGDEVRQRRRSYGAWIAENHPTTGNKAELGRLIAAEFGGSPDTHANRLREGSYYVSFSGGRWVLGDAA